MNALAGRMSSFCLSTALHVYYFDDAPAKGVASIAVRVGGVCAITGDFHGINDGLSAMHAVIDAPGNGHAQGQGRRADIEEDMPRIKLKVADDLTCSEKDDFFKAACLVVNSYITQKLMSWLG